jgi:hypothetical protein
MSTSPEFLSTKEVADSLNESIKNVTRRVQAGELNYVKKFPGVRGAMLFDPSDVTALKKTLDEKAPARRASTDASSAGASFVSEEVAS